MGSLMAGWDSPVLDPKQVKYKRNWSLTKEEIDSYWKLKKKIEEEHLKAISPSDSNQEGKYDEEYSLKQGGLIRSSSLPDSKTKRDIMDMNTEKSLEEFIKKNGWWRSSNWAFLNEPPVLERAGNTYAAQFHIANLANTKLSR